MGPTIQKKSSGPDGPEAPSNQHKEATSICRVAESSYYFKEKKAPQRGMKASQTTLHKQSGQVDEQTVVEAIKQKLSQVH